MTIEERDTARAIQAIAKHLGSRAIDWEQRRYEIAKDMLVAYFKKNVGYSDDIIVHAVHKADVLINELRNNPMK